MFGKKEKKDKKKKKDKDGLGGLIRITIENHYLLSPLGVDTSIAQMPLKKDQTFGELHEKIILKGCMAVEDPEQKEKCKEIMRNMVFIVVDSKSEKVVKGIEVVTKVLGGAQGDTCIIFCDPVDIDKKFEAMLDDLGLDEGKRAAMRLMGMDKKRVMLQGQRMRGRNAEPSHFIDILKNDALPLKNADTLKVCLVNEPVEWVTEFVNLGGVRMFCKVFNNLVRKTPLNDQDKLLVSRYLEIFKATSNSHEGLAGVLQSAGAFDAVILSLEIVSERNVASTFQLLAAIAVLSPEAHKEILSNIEGRLKPWLEKLLQEDVISLIKESVMMLINCLIKGMQAADSVPFREKFNLDNLVKTMSSDRTATSTIKKQAIAYGKLTRSQEQGTPNPDWASAKHKDFSSKVQDLFSFQALWPVLDSIAQHLSSVPKSPEYFESIDKFLIAAAMSGSGAPGAIIRQFGQVVGVDMAAAGGGELETEYKQLQDKVQQLEAEISRLSSSSPPAEGGGPPPPPPPPGSGGGPPPPPPPPGSGGGPPPPPPPPGSGGGPPPPPPPPGGGPPPPPGGGPPPPPGGGPPPPPGGGPKPDPKKPVIKPGVKMRGFNWQKLNYKQSGGTMWDGVDESNLMNQLNKDQIKTLFAEKPKVDPSKKAGEGGAGGPLKSPKQQKISLLDPKRAQNMSIMLSRFRKYTFQQIREAIRTVDLNILTLDNLLCLKTYCPEPEEIALCKEFEGDVALLGQPELFIRCLGELPMLKMRLNCIIIKLSFLDKFSEASLSLSKVTRAVDAIHHSKKFEELLKVILALGNYINGSTPRGGAFGFKISALPRLGDTKSVSNPKETLLHYLVSICEDIKPQLLSIPDDLKELAGGTETEPDQVALELRDLESNMKMVENGLKQFKEGEQILRFLKPFYEENASRIKESQDALEKIKEKFEATQKKYGAGTMKYPEFVSTIHKFTTQFGSAIAQKKAEREKAAKGPAKKLPTSKGKMAPPRNAARHSHMRQSQMEGKGLMDNALKSISAGDY